MKTRLEFKKTPIEGLMVAFRKPIAHDLGSLVRVYCQQEVGNVISNFEVSQINHTFTKTMGSVRGMHYQRAPYSEAKFVSCLRGKVLDVAIDLRLSSKTFLCWHAEVLSFDNNKSMLIPEGFAHGFQALSDDCEMLYLHNKPYNPSAESGLHPLDKRLDIDWPLEVTNLSSRDKNLDFISDNFKGE
jgi:dTDP-4-dehydrorhamnose 3,5-epimerase